MSSNTTHEQQKEAAIIAIFKLVYNLLPENAIYAEETPNNRVVQVDVQNVEK